MPSCRPNPNIVKASIINNAGGCCHRHKQDVLGKGSKDRIDGWVIPIESLSQLPEEPQ